MERKGKGGVEVSETLEAPLVCNLVDKYDPILKQKTERFNFSNPPCDPIELAHKLTQTMLHNNGIGLAAPQIGLPYRVFSLRTSPILVCFNPLVVDVSSETIELEEGCLTFPNLFLKIRRPSIVKVRFTLPNGETKTEKFVGITARAFQHEVDHLDGILFTQKVSNIELAMARKKAQKARRK